MLKLYGFTLSNYFNMVKMALLEKNIEFEVVNTKPSQETDYLIKSPMGKVPCLETPDGFISETAVIFEYLEDLQQGPALFPSDPFQKAKVRELIHEIELYIELPARTLYPEVYFGGKVSDEVKEKAVKVLQRGVACLQRNGKFSPFVAGDTFTYADIMYFYSIGLAAACSKKLLDLKLLADFPEAKALSEQLAQRESAKQVAADQQAG